MLQLTYTIIKVIHNYIEYPDTKLLSITIDGNRLTAFQNLALDVALHQNIAAEVPGSLTQTAH